MGEIILYFNVIVHSCILLQMSQLILVSIFGCCWHFIANDTVRAGHFVQIQNPQTVGHT